MTEAKDSYGYGQGWFLLKNARIFRGEFKHDLLAVGETSELQPDKSRKVYSVIYDYKRDRNFQTSTDDQFPIKKELLRIEKK